MQYYRLRFALAVMLLSLLMTGFNSMAQVNTVTYGKNRIQYKKFNWKFYQTPNFNAYYNEGGADLAKFVVQVAEEELIDIENFIEYGLQRRANIIIYNSYDDFKTSNIGLGNDWQQSSGGLTKLVNNKVVVFFDGNHANLRKQVRQGIAKILTDNLLFGDDLGEIASNQALLDLPKWLTDGYISYVAERWSTNLDNDLKNAIMGGTYKNFYHFAFDKPMLAGHAFWWFIDEKYKRENVTYFLYLARLYKNLNSASQKICKKKFKDVLSEFMEFQDTKYMEDLRKRRNAPRGRLSIVEETTPNKDFFRFQANPNPKSSDYAYVQFKNGIYTVKLIQNFDDPKTLVKYGVRTNVGDINPNYPVIAWDPKGTRLLVMHWSNGKIQMFIYDLVNRIKKFKQQVTGVDQILDANFMLNSNTLLMSCVKNGRTDIFTYDIEKDKLTQMTNDIYDDLDPTFVSFPNRSGIIFSSNRPSSDASKADTALPSRYPFNIYMIDNFNKSEIKQISKLTDVKRGNARFPMQYNTNHFTFVSDENGIHNRWAGFFSTSRDGLDTLYYIGDEVLRNPTLKEFDSTLMAWQKQEPDSVSFFQVYKDSTYTFPITNYASSLQETRIAGDRGQVTETRQEGEFKFLYKLRVDSITLRNRNVNLKPSNYMNKLITWDKVAKGKAITTTKPNGAAVPTTLPGIPATTIDTAGRKKFQTEFDDEPADTTTSVLTTAPDGDAMPPTLLERSKLFNYRLKFNADYVLAGVTNNVLVNRYQPYQGGSGPVQLNNGNDVNWSFRVGVADLFEDIKFIGGYRFGFSLNDKDAFLSFQNYRRRLDWGFTYYRSNVTNFNNFFTGIFNILNNNVITNIYQVNVAYPINEVKSIRAQIGYRTDRGVLRPFNKFNGGPEPAALDLSDSTASTLLGKIEYVHDNTINPAQNIYNGLRYKVYFESTMPMGKTSSIKGKTTYVFGFDARHYLKIYRNFIWATRASADFSFGTARMLYYLGGVDGWVNPRFNDANRPAPDATYAFQTLAVNMRGFNQNVANGNNAVVINSELRLPVFTTFFNSPINNAFLRNFQLVQFFDLGAAWNGAYNGIKRPVSVYRDEANPNNPVTVRVKAGGIGPFAGGYGFGARSMLLGYFLKFDAAWEMNGIFRGKPIYYFALGLDF